MLNTTDMWTINYVVEIKKENFWQGFFWTFYDYKNERFQLEWKILAVGNFALLSKPQIISVVGKSCCFTKGNNEG